MIRLLRSFRWALIGLRTVWREELNFKIETGIAAVALVAAYELGFSQLEWVILVFAIALVLAAEIVNTAIEDICNKIEPNQDPIIGKVKDVMAGYVLVSSLAAATIGVLLFFF